MAQPRAMPDYNLLWAAVAALAGAALYCGVFVLGRFGANGPDPRWAWILTPLFIGPLAAYLVYAGRLRAGGLIGLVILLTMAHFVAVWVASSIYKMPVQSEIADLWSMVYDSPAQKAARAAGWSHKMDLARTTALQAGAWAGGVGALLAFLGLLLFGGAFRSPTGLSVALLCVAALAGIGAFAFSDRLPSDMAPEEFALRLYAPWQAVFGLALAFLFAAHRLTVRPA